MKTEQKDFLGLQRIPGVLNRDEASWVTGFSPSEIDILVGAGRLTPLGKPKKNSKKIFAAVEIERCMHDLDWLNRAQQVIQQFWLKKNRSRCSKNENLGGEKEVWISASGEIEDVTNTRSSDQVITLPINKKLKGGPRLGASQNGVGTPVHD